MWKGAPMQFEIGVNMEFIRSEDKSFEDGVRRAADLGYQWVEPMVHNGRESDKRSAFVFAGLARRSEGEGVSLCMFNPSSEDFLGATNSSPPEGMFHIAHHQSISRTTEGLLRIVNLVDSPMLRI